MKKKQKYSFSERFNYHHQRLVSSDISKPMTSKEQYSAGFVQIGMGHDRPLDFEERSLSYQKGCIAAEKAIKKAFSKKL